MGTGAPFLAGGLAFLDCQVVQRYQAGHNTLFIGQVVEIKEGSPGMPLVYYDRTYRQLG
jgi:flavin reductase (DIM6/NTAB) family NADH-FMN oxidoreductase RutF